MTQKKSSLSALFIFALCFLAYTASYAGRHNFEACVTPMATSGIITASFGGIIMAVYKIVYGAGQLINGLLGCHISPKYMIGAGLLGGGVMNILTGLAVNDVSVLVFWALNGFFLSMLWAPIIRVFAEWMTDRKSSYRACVNISVSIPVGTILAYIIPSAVFGFRPEGWRTVFIICGAVLIFAFICWITGINVLRSYIAGASRLYRENAAGQVNKTSDNAHKVSLMSLMIPSGMLFAVFALIFNGSLKDSISDWIPSFFSETYGMSPSESALISVVIPVVCIAGAYVAAWIDKRFLHNQMYTGGAMFVLSFICIAVQFPVMLIPGTAGALLCAFLLAVSVSAMWGANTMFLSLMPLRFSGSGKESALTGFLDCCAYVGAAAATYIYGLFLGTFGGAVPIFLLWLAFAFCGITVCLIGGRDKVLYFSQIKKSKKDRHARETLVE